MKKLPHTFHVTVGKPATPCIPWSPTAGDQLLPEDPLSPATLQPVTPAPGSPGPAAASALLRPALPLLTPCVCVRARACACACVCMRAPGPADSHRNPNFPVFRSCSVLDHLDPTGCATVPTVLGWEHFCFDDMAMFSMGDR